ncbi:MAG: beta-glucosidase [Spirochaetia bacterium]|nr:beta-glucosidase [Spirochaetia bacterium]
MNHTRLHFPNDFSWGSSTASYQIEGACDEDGRGRSIWDTFSHIPGSIIDGTSGDIACDHYHRYREDIALMRQLNQRHYRFSTSWSRVIPEGSGQINQSGLDFYSSLVDTLLENGITPYLTLYHWDLPQALQEKGGWQNRDTAYQFAAYAQVMAEHLGDRVNHWMTHNEPWVSSFVGNLYGEHAPGLKDLGTALQVSHHILLSHGLAVPAIRSASTSPDTSVGIVNNLEWVEPASSDAADVAAASRHDGAFNRWFLDPIFKGSYPEDMLSWYGNDAPEIAPGDMRIISTPTDFMGVNYYTRRIIAHDPHGDFLHTRRVIWPFIDRAEYESWEKTPEALYRLLVRVKDDYDNPVLYITENGTPLQDQVSITDGKKTVHDELRIDYLKRHMGAAWQALADGVRLKGYFVWSTLDNFEWNLGTSKRFGLVYVDYETQERIIKESGKWFSEVSRTNSI